MIFCISPALPVIFYSFETNSTVNAVTIKTIEGVVQGAEEKKE